jgi:hypothetical protein
MIRQAKRFYEFDSFRLDMAEGLLLRAGESVPLPPKALETLGIVMALVVAVDCIVFNPNGIRWTSDGRALTYRDKGSGVWSQSLDGSSPKRLGPFQSDLIFDLAWSRDARNFSLCGEPSAPRFLLSD